MASLLTERPPRHLLFTGKGGVGKTSVACATAVALADRGRRVLLVSTDPASNLDEVLGVALGPTPAPVPSVPGLAAMNLDPDAAARAYRERVVGPYRNLLPEAALRSIEEQLSGACTVEIAAFDEFSKLLGDPQATAAFDHVILDTAPTGHTLRLLELPAAWSEFIATSAGGTSCLGPLAGLSTQQALYQATRAALTDPQRTAVVLVSRAEAGSLAEAERTRRELAELDMIPALLVINGLLVPSDGADPVALAMAERGRTALAAAPAALAALPRETIPLRPFELVGIDALRSLLGGEPPARPLASEHEEPAPPALPWNKLLEELARPGHGVILTMGKGGVGKTSVAVAIALALAERGHEVLLTTTDPAAHLESTLQGAAPPGLRVGRIDPTLETQAYIDETLRVAGASLDEDGKALLAEELRSPCTTEIAVFRAFARAVDAGERGFVVVDTAPTGHTLLLLDAAEAYHREVNRASGHAPEEVRQLLPRLRDPAFARVVLVTLPEATPIHEAAQLQKDLVRARIQPFAWVMNQSLSPVQVSDPLLRRKRASERRYLQEVAAQTPRMTLLPWRAPAPSVGAGPPSAALSG